MTEPEVDSKSRMKRLAVTSEPMQDTPEWQGRQRTVLDNMKSSLNMHKGELARELRNARERLEHIIACTPSGEARNVWTEAHIHIMLAEESMIKAIKTTLKLLD